MYSPVSPRASKVGFSLVELLVAISVVAVLATLIISVISGVRERADRVSCASQLRQLGAALELYAVDHNGNTPFDGRDKDTGNMSPATWKMGDRLMIFGELFTYLNIPEDVATTPDILICPSYENFETYKEANLTRKSKSARYWMNPDVTSNTENTDNLMTIRSNTVMICDVLFWWNLGLYGPENHGGKGMNAYMKDGSIRWIPYTSLQNVNAWDWNGLAKAEF